MKVEGFTCSVLSLKKASVNIIEFNVFKCVKLKLNENIYYSNIYKYITFERFNKTLLTTGKE